MNLNRYLVAALTALVWLAGSAALADNLKPAPWQDLVNPHPFSTYSEWVFDSAVNPRDADTVVNVGDGSATFPRADMFDMVFEPNFLNGAWFPDGTLPPSSDPADWAAIQLTIPNWIDDEPLKRIRVQITFHAAEDMGEPFAMPEILGISGMEGSQLVSGFPVIPEPEVELLDSLDGIWHMYDDWNMTPNPDFEQIYIGIPQDVGVLQIVTDTISIPEPSTVALALFGSLAIARFVRRR